MLRLNNGLVHIIKNNGSIFKFHSRKLPWLGELWKEISKFKGNCSRDLRAQNPD